MAGLEQLDHFKPLLKATVIGSRDSSRVPSWSGFGSAGFNSDAGHEAPAGRSPPALAGGAGERLRCQPGTGPSRALSYRLYFAPLALTRRNPIPCPQSRSGSSPRPCQEVLLSSDPQRPRGTH